jgi:hypothetical protein
VADTRAGLLAAPGGRGACLAHCGRRALRPYAVGGRDIATGEELTNDYATSTGGDEFTMPCGCGSPLCRGLVTGRDWQLPELQRSYGEHWVPALLDRIRRSPDRPA